MDVNEQGCACQTEEIEDLAVLSNEPLPDAELSMLRGLLIQAENQVSLLEKDAAQPKTTLTDSRSRRMESLARVKRLRTAVAPHRKVPPEILLKIFLCAVDSLILFLPPSPNHFIWSLMQVCSRWRQIITAEPDFWREIRVIDSKYPKSLNALTHNIFINHGRECPITYQPPFIANEEVWEDLINLLSAHPTRFKHIYFIFGDFSPSPLCHIPPVELDHLESIDFVFQSRGIYQADVPAMGFFKSGSLRSISFYTQDQCLSTAWVDHTTLPWAQLQELTMDSITTAALVPVLRQCVSLVECAVVIPWDHSPQNVLEEPMIRLGHLKSLTFSPPTGTQAARKLINILIAPALKNLSFRGEGWGEWDQESVLQLIARSASSLETLDVGGTVP